MAAAYKFQFYHPPLPRPDVESTVCVDGAVEEFRCLTHWPGHGSESTPKLLKADLSTGIALNFIKLPEDQQRSLMGDFDTISSNHVDTDGVCAVFTMMYPSEAQKREAEMLAAAAAGDFRHWKGEKALATSLTIEALGIHPDSPLSPAIRGLTMLESQAYTFQWIIDRLPAILDDPWVYKPLWEAEFNRVVIEVHKVEARDGVKVDANVECDLAIVTSDRALGAVPLYYAAGPCNRVLLVQPAAEGTKYHFMYRPESWYAIPRPATPRKDLQPVVDSLSKLEAEAREQSATPVPESLGGDATSAEVQRPRWWCHTADSLICHLAFSNGDDTGFLGMEKFSPEDEPRSLLKPEQVVDALVRAIA